MNILKIWPQYSPQYRIKLEIYGFSLSSNFSPCNSQFAKSHNPQSCSFLTKTKKKTNLFCELNNECEKHF